MASGRSRRQVATAEGSGKTGLQQNRTTTLAVASGRSRRQVATAKGKWLMPKLVVYDSDAPIGTCEAKLQPVPTSASMGEGERGERE